MKCLTRNEINRKNFRDLVERLRDMAEKGQKPTKGIDIKIKFDSVGINSTGLSPQQTLAFLNSIYHIDYSRKFVCPETDYNVAPDLSLGEINYADIVYQTNSQSKETRKANIFFTIKK